MRRMMDDNCSCIACSSGCKRNATTSRQQHAVDKGGGDGIDIDAQNRRSLIILVKAQVIDQKEIEEAKFGKE